MDDKQSQNFNDLAAMLDGHQITDETGQITDEEQTSTDATATQEKNAPVKDTATAEKSADSDSSVPNTGEADSENELAEDETGKRYVPEGRFKEVYGKLKQKERELEAAKQSSSQANPLQDNLQTNQSASQPAFLDQTTAIELEVLKTTLPQFDPESEDYSKELDQLGATIYKAAGHTDSKGRFMPGTTRLQAARQAVAQAKGFTKNQIAIASEARKVKALQSDQGITRAQTARTSQELDPAKMSFEAKEKWLKDNGHW